MWLQRPNETIATYTTKTFAFIETLTSMKMAYNGEWNRKCNPQQKLYMLDFWIESTSVIGKWKMYVAMHAATQKQKGQTH